MLFSIREGEFIAVAEESEMTGSCCTSTRVSYFSHPKRYSYASASGDPWASRQSDIKNEARRHSYHQARSRSFSQDGRSVSSVITASLKGQGFSCKRWDLCKREPGGMAAYDALLHNVRSIVTFGAVSATDRSGDQMSITH